ncbi:hypothetical protein, partial [Pectobacterium aquaticum]|uniref:hypothetical protein n=1 Tax=Pectobacterium aquaticum TaxID=2204145 RepID=UPI001D02E6B3
YLSPKIEEILSISVDLIDHPLHELIPNSNFQHNCAFCATSCSLSGVNHFLRNGCRFFTRSAQLLAQILLKENLS